MRSFLITLIILLFFGGLAFIYYHSKEPETGPLDPLALCIEESGAKFYGAFWDIPTRNQQKEFGPSKRFLPYVECTASSKMYQFQNDECKEVGVETYPTWKFENGTYFFGLLKPEELARKTNCPMPEPDID
jgi:hypothetical protein